MGKMIDRSEDQEQIAPLTGQGREGATKLARFAADDLIDPHGCSPLYDLMTKIT